MALFASSMMVVAVLIVGGVIDFMSLVTERRQVQDAADNAALGAVREVQVAQGDKDRLRAVAKSIAESTLGNLKDVKVVTQPRDGNMLEVSVTAAPRVFFPGVIGLTAQPVTATAVAVVSGSPVCMIGLDTKVKRTLDMRSSAAITAKACGIYSNSAAKDGVAIADSARVNADLICSAGGVKLAKSYTVSPAPVTDCPAMPDPLANRPPPAVGACGKNKLKIDKGQTETLQPGTYCDGIEIKGNVTLAAGVYVLKGGSLKVKDGGNLTGTDVGFYLTGDKALIEFEKESKISLAAPRSGPLAGLLFFEDRGVVAADQDAGTETDADTGLPKAKEHRIRSDDASRLVGTIYLPRNRLLIDGQNPIAQESAYTVIIAREFALAEGPEVVLNADYSHSDVPVPKGVGDKSSKSARLIR
ncbi:MAG: pilus assembly protein TadG-related protein [Methyloceanibacter sp.]